MFKINFSAFSKTKDLENKIDLFHDKLLDVSMTFKKAVKEYLAEKRSPNYKKNNKQIKTVEHDADTLRRGIEESLYSQNLIPDVRADVLELIEQLDKVINKYDEVSYRFYVEQPDIPEIYHKKILELVDWVVDCTENLKIASRSFFKNLSAVRDYSQKVYFIEHETDLVSGELKREIFNSDIELAHKMQLRDFINDIADIADIAEDCVDALAIFSIKRDL
ncbi:MAG: DUF47 family protein [Alphaproteobacteria bacterium]